MRKIISYQSFPVSYLVEGEGLPAMLIHGFAEDWHIWENQIKYLSKHFKLICPDLPGSGQSPYNESLSTVEELGGCLPLILDAEYIASCAVIGHSMGGYAALAMAEKWPVRLQALGLFHSTACADSEEKKEARRKGIAFIESHGSHDFVRQSIPNLFSEMFKNEHPGIISQLVNRYNNFNPLSLVSYYNAMMVRPDRTRVLKVLRKPVLLIAGDEDKAVPIAQSLQQSHIPDLCYFHILTGAAHMGMIERTNLSNAILENFLSEVLT
ncbi:MAG TPA: alpha/beta hydrolase [Puia sp.]|nr:alpha/beta hydrolase [Puia sp.]